MDKHGGSATLLVDTGAGINIIKENVLPRYPVKPTKCKTFFMGQDKYITDRQMTMNIYQKSQIFYIVPKDFPLIEDGIIGLPLLKQYDYNVTNEYLELNGNRIYFQEDQPVQPGQTIVKTIYLDHRPTRVCYTNTGEQPIKANDNILSFESDLNDLTKFKQAVRLDHIEQSLRQPIERILTRYISVFNLSTNSLPCTNLTEHTITLTQNKIINSKSYRPPEAHKEEIEKQMKEMLDKRIIEPSDSPYNSPVWVVPKKLDASGKQKWRIVIDFRKLNELTDQDAYPLPQIDDILSQLGNAKFFSALDLSSGFHQIPMNPDSKKFTAFSTPQGHFHYNRMPFGLKNAPATFQRMMDVALRGLVNKYCFVYLDDIIIFGNTIQQHNDNLAIVLQRLLELGLKIQPDKCEFLKPELEYLGHVITEKGIKPNNKKLEAVANFKQPKNPTDVKSFLGLSGYYRKFIKNFSKIAKPLTELTKKNNPFKWTDTEQKSFDTLKQKLCTAPVLTYPDFNKTFTLTTDASNDGLGAILSQDNHPCCYISRTLNNPEKNYTTTEKELLAIVWAVRRLRQYLLGRKFIIQTDHQALVWLKNCKDPSSRLMRWRLKLEEYEYDIHYVKGKENSAADSLSRKIYNITNNYLEQYETWTRDVDSIPKRLRITPNDPTFYQLTKETLGPYDKEIWLNKFMEIGKQYKKIGIGDSFDETEKARIKTFALFYNDLIEEITFAYDPILTLTDEQIQTVLKENHNDVIGHLGIQKTYDRIRFLYKIPHLMEKVENFVKSCDTCQRQKLVRIRPREQAVIPQTPTQPNDKISMDLIGPLTKTKNNNTYILSIHDDLTKYLILVPLRSQKTETIIEALLNHYIYIFSAPKTILTDQGQSFISDLMKKFEEAFKIRHIKTTSFHPQSNGSLERTHAVIKDLIRTSLQDNNQEWDEILNQICLGYNTARHDATGYSPFELTFGRQANLPSSISKTSNYTYEEMYLLWQKQFKLYHDKARNTLEQSRKRYARDQNRKIIRSQAIFNIGDHVLIHNDHKTDKLDDEWLGPYVIKEISTPYYIIEINAIDKKIHGNRLKPYISGLVSSSG